MESAPTINFTGHIVQYDDPFGNDESDYFEQRRRMMMKVFIVNQITDLIKLFVCIAVIIVDVYLIVIISRNEKLKAMKANRIIKHYAIFNILMLMSLPFIPAILDRLDMYVYRIPYCMAEQLETTSVMCLFLCALVLAVDWLITVRFTNVQPMYKKINEYSILFVYILWLLNLFADLFICHVRSFEWLKLLDGFSFIFIIIFVSICNCRRRITDKESNYPISIANIIIFTWAPMFAYHLLFLMFRYEWTINFILGVTNFIPEYLAFANPIIITIWLYAVNKEFKTAFRRSCSCCPCCKSIDGSDAENVRTDDTQILENEHSSENEPTVY